jgi:hypothetical protein
MNPTDLLLLALSLSVAVLALVARGGSAPGAAPAVPAVAGGAWQIWLQCLRHRSWLGQR